MLRYVTAGESHGQALITIIENVPSNLSVRPEMINHDLKRRQSGYGRGGRMKIESDQIQILSGVRHGRTIGSPVAMLIENRDWKNWSEIMSPEPVDIAEGDQKKAQPVTRPRPGHADISGAIKYNHSDIRNVLERSSARETAARVAAGGFAKALLKEFGIEVYSWVTEIGGVRNNDQQVPGSMYYSGTESPPELASLFIETEKSEVRCPCAELTEAIKKRIDKAKEDGDSLGGIFEVVVSGLPVGLGSHVQADKKLDGLIAGAMMSIQAIKGVEIGVGFEEGRRPGSQVHDEIFYRGQGSGARDQENLESATGFYRKTNHAGGIEGGMTNGKDVVVRAAMKPIPTLYKPLMSVDISTKEPFEASIERSDVCAVPAAAVIGEAVVAFELAKVFLDGGFDPPA